MPPRLPRSTLFPYTTLFRSTVEVTPEQPGVLGDLEVAVERYFPDFALDGQNQPYSRSDEPRNPAALLQVSRGGQDRKSTRLNSSHMSISYAVFCLKNITNPV